MSLEAIMIPKSPALPLNMGAKVRRMGTRARPSRVELSMTPASRLRRGARIRTGRLSDRIFFALIQSNQNTHSTNRAPRKRLPMLTMSPSIAT